MHTWQGCFAGLTMYALISVAKGTSTVQSLTPKLRIKVRKALLYSLIIPALFSCLWGGYALIIFIITFDYECISTLYMQMAANAICAFSLADPNYSCAVEQSGQLRTIT